MIVRCKKCGCESLYTGNPCPDCNTKFTLTQDELNGQLSILRDAVKNRRYTEALECYRILADEGYTDAEKEYAKILEEGRFAPRNLDLAMAYFYRAAKKNDAYSAYKYSRLATRENDDTARFWLIYSAILGCVEAYPVVAEEFSKLGYEKDAHYFYSLAAACDDVESIVTIAKRYYDGIGTDASAEHAKWYMDKLKIPPIYAIKLAYKLRHQKAKEPPMATPKNYDGLLRMLTVQAKKCGFNTAYLRLCEILAERGDIEAEAIVGKAITEGDGCKQDFTKGLTLLTQASAKGSITAHIALGDIYLKCSPSDKNPRIAIDHYKKAGELGSAESYELAGDIYYTGSDIEQDIGEAVKLYDMASNLGSASARKKSDGIKKERDALYERALAVEKFDPEDAFRCYSLSASMGHQKAQFSLARCYEEGIGTRKNRHGAFVLYKKAAELGERESLLKLGICYAHGFGTRLDYKKATEYLQKAERCGVKEARDATIAIMERKLSKLASRTYSKAMRLVYQKKFKTAKRILEVSAELMYPKAIYTLGCLYEFGIGAELDKNKAYDLYEKAYSLFFRDPRAKYKLSVLRLLKKSL